MSAVIRWAGSSVLLVAKPRRDRKHSRPRPERRRELPTVGQVTTNTMTGGTVGWHGFHTEDRERHKWPKFQGWL
jgi:hypothetical protein